MMNEIQRVCLYVFYHVNCFTYKNDLINVFLFLNWFFVVEFGLRLQLIKRNLFYV